MMFSVVNNFKVMQLFEKDEEQKNYAGVIETAREMGGRFHDVFDRFYIREQVKVDLAAEALNQIASDKDEITLRKLGDGYIVKIEDGILTAPQGARSGLLKCGKQITGMRGFFNYYTVTRDGERQDVLFYRQITGPYYFVEIVGRGGNIKTIGNKDIKNVINLTKLNSWVAITIKVDVTYPLTEVETILTETLPRVGEQHKEIISGPYYKGVLSVEGGFAVLSIIAECSEGNYYRVERTLVREVLVALREKNVPVK